MKSTIETKERSTIYPLPQTFPKVHFTTLNSELVHVAPLNSKNRSNNTSSLFDMFNPVFIATPTGFSCMHRSIPLFS